MPALAAVGVPSLLRQKQIAVEHRAELAVEAGVAQMHPHDAVVHLAAGPTVLMVHARGLLPLLGMARFVNDPDRLRLGMVTSHNALHRVSQSVVVPLRQRQKLLKRSWRHFRQMSDRLDALAGQIAELPLDVFLQVLARVR